MTLARFCRNLAIGILGSTLQDTQLRVAAEGGADIHPVAQLLGHKDVRMTARYQHLSPEFVACAVARPDGADRLADSTSASSAIPHQSQSVEQQRAGGGSLGADGTGVMKMDLFNGPQDRIAHDRLRGPLAGEIKEA